ncbi:phosphatidylinositol-glycan biosynthesis class F protein [Anoplophora glabripennis]|uniref:phosphatidylinositol-glycan biosynthesis class F protein n=1 Tax=Anoplophora glabripennis TaxID=217634 RepID=UPI0008752F08|nr:phosphatidylinositol-glycan biosynthesis class F protein [Anoplophora glabripennis]
MNIMETSFVSRKTLAFNNAVTCIYLPLLVTFLNYTGDLYNVGKPETAYVGCVLILAEVLKYIKCCLLPNGNTKKSEPKKYKIYGFFKGILTIASMTIVFYIAAVLFGAPFFSKHYQTFIFAFVLSILTILPCCLFLGPDSVPILIASLTFFEGSEIYENFLFNIRLTIFGAWLGAVLIPLDWDKPYQVWPVPCYLGAIAGCLVSNFISFISLSFCMPPKKTGKYYL